MNFNIPDSYFAGHGHVTRAGGKPHLAQLLAVALGYGQEPWIRYVDPENGSDSADGETATAAWRTWEKVELEYPVLGALKVIVVAPGTLDGPCRLRAGLGTTIIVGTVEDVYADCTYVAASFQESGTATKEKWTQIDLDYSGQSGFVLDDTLLDYYLEMRNAAGSIHRMKINEYADLGSNQVRLILDSATFTADISATDPRIRIVRMASTISVNSTTQAALAIESSIQAFGGANKFSSFAGGVSIFNIQVENKATNGCALTMSCLDEVNLGGAFIKNGSVLSARSILVRNMTSGTSVTIPMFGADAAAVIEPRGATSSTPGFCIGRENAMATIALYKPQGNDYFVMSDLRPSGTLYLSDVFGGIMFLFKRAGLTYVTRSSISLGNQATLGQALYIDGTYGYGEVMHSTSSLGVGFRGAPMASFGRVTLVHGARFVDHCSAGFDFGDVSSYTDSAPLLLVDKQSEARFRVIIGGVGNECVAATEMIHVKGGSGLTLSGDSVIYHGNATTQPSAITFAVEEGSVLRVGKSKSLTINAYTDPSSAYGVLYLSNSTYIHDDEQYAPVAALSIVQGKYSNSPLLYSWSSKIICDADVNLTTETFSYGAINASYSEIIVTGDITLDGDWHAGYFWFCRLAFNNIIHTLNGYAEADALEFDHCDVDLNNYRVDSFDFGAGAIVKIHRGSTVFLWSVTDGDVTYNRNTNASGYGVEVRDGSSLINNHARGWDGTAGEIKLGSAAGYKSYPSAGVSVTDIVDSSEGVSELCMVKSIYT